MNLILEQQQKVQQGTNFSAKLYSYDAGSQKDMFVDANYIESAEGIRFGVNVPVKSLLNPLFETGENIATWDYDKYYQTVLKIGSIWYMWYATYSVAPNIRHNCIATSPDGINWTKPNLSLITYDGNTDNNIIQADGSYNPSIVYDADGAIDSKYIMSIEVDEGGTTGGSIYLFKSPDGIVFTKFKTLTKAGSVYCEAKEIIKRTDGRWIAYYSYQHVVNQRAIGAFLSDSTDVEGAWTDQGIIISTTSINSQKYTIGVEIVDDIYYGFVSNYNSTNGTMYIDLYVSRDGLSWMLVRENWIPLGASDSWEDGFLLAGKSLIQDGDKWRHYYSGCKENHSYALLRDSRIGLAEISYKRIGVVRFNGNLITSAFTPTTGLFINADLRPGHFKVELLDGSTNEILSGFSKDNMDSISGDTYSTEIKWGGNSIPTDIELKIKFYFISSNIINQLSVITSPTSSSVTDITATVSAMLDCKEQLTTWSIEYGDTDAYGSTQIGNTTINGGLKSVGLTGLTQGSVVHWRFKAVNSSGTSYSADQIFTTATNWVLPVTGRTSGTATEGTLVVSTSENITPTVTGDVTISVTQTADDVYVKHTITVNCPNNGSGTIIIHDSTKVVSLGNHRGSTNTPNVDFYAGNPSTAPILTWNMNLIPSTVKKINQATALANILPTTGNQALPSITNLKLYGNNIAWSYSGALPSTLVAFTFYLAGEIAWSYSGNLPSNSVIIYLYGSKIDWTGLSISGSNNIATLELRKFRQVKLTSAEMLTFINSLINRVGTLPATGTINDYADYAAPTQAVLDAKAALIIAKGCTLTLGA